MTHERRRASSWKKAPPAHYNAAMTHADAFLQAILDAPDDDAPRLLFADWLDEQGDPDRAEFIRVQIALERRAPPGLRRREQELLSLHESEWAAPVQGMATEWTFRRGFIDDVRTDAVVLAERRRIVSTSAGSPRATVLDGKHAEASAVDRRVGRLPSFRQAPWPGPLRLPPSSHRRSFGHADLAAPDASDLAPAQRLRRRRRRRPRPGPVALPDSAHTPGPGGNGISAAGVRTLALSVELRATGGDPPRLRSLRLHDNPFGEAGQRAIHASPLLRPAPDLVPSRGAARTPSKK